MSRGRNISLLKRASKAQVKKVIQSAAEKAPSLQQVGESLGGAAKTFAHGAGVYLQGAGRLGGAIAKGMGAQEGGQAVGRAAGIAAGAIVPYKLVGMTEPGAKVERAVESGVSRAAGAVGRGVRTITGRGGQQAYYDPYGGQY